MDVEGWHLLCCSRPVPLSLADTWTMPLASMSKVTSIWGTPRGAGGIPTSVNWPSNLLSNAISLSPWQTLISTCVCPSAAVENTCRRWTVIMWSLCAHIHEQQSWHAAKHTWLFLVGMVVFLLMSFVKTPPRVSIPSERGVTSKSNTSVTSPARTPPWMAAPIATASSGLTDLLGARPNSSWTVCWTCRE